MAGIPQDKRPLQVSTTLGPDHFIVTGFRGEEGVSSPYLFELDLLSEDEKVDGQKLLRSPVGVTVDREEEAPVQIHGLVRRFVQLGQSEGVTSYRAEIVPWFWFLTLTRDCRIFQEKSVPDIVEEVFKALGFSDYDFKLSGSYPKREYCVQYRESNFDFVSRLLEEEGIHYHFRHTGKQHVMVLSDQSKLAPACDDGSTPLALASRDRKDTVQVIEATHGVFVGEVELRDFDFEQAPTPLVSSSSGKGEERVYDFHPGRFTSRDAGERFARIALEADEARQHVLRGSGNCRYFRAGHRFDLAGHYRKDLDQGYFLTSVRHRASGGSWRSAGVEDFDYEVHFEAIPLDIPFRPAAGTVRPRITGSQTAVVVGKKGEEIWVDKYGRVKVKFHWDRSDTRDEGSSCWVRVSTSWAGKNWGAIQLPRIGEEVIVAFLEGDPDRPIVIGRVYNADHMPPYALPDNKTQSGVKSRSSKGAEPKNFNEIRFEDLKGKEQVYIRAEKDKVVVVENDRTETVGNDEKILIKNDRTEEVKQNESITIGENRTESVGKDEEVTIGENRTHKVGQDEEVTVDGKRTESVGKDESVTVGGKRAVSVSKDDALSVGGKGTVDVTGAYNLSSKNKVVIEAVAGIELKVGPNSIKIEPSGITVSGIKLDLEGKTTATLKGGVTATVDGGAMTEVKASGMLKIQGSITMIN